ncbi:probable serine/threonine-protein kinase PBL28 [Durio zibethinus]|uniref:non-specific serine/threonine protein kinase n=1 Tax=Durio zibethinus TaxID=66656 RepID=A0A6P5ZMP9_DURZI|nr:probable serine/threonine-protein kinase PBL28 [Durio zibethinus]
MILINLSTYTCTHLKDYSDIFRSTNTFYQTVETEAFPLLPGKSFEISGQVVLDLKLASFCKVMTVNELSRLTVELERVNTSKYVGAPSPEDAQNIRQLTMSELEHATHNFSQSNIISEGRFGLVYKGLLRDGAIVAIKRCLNTRVHLFHHEVKQIAQVSHKHLVKLVGYCEDSHHQFLVYDYIPNGNVGNHLYDSQGSPAGKLNMRQRLLIALGAAKGLEYLHSLASPLLHMHFRTSNVLIDETFTAKVSDYGLSKLVSEDQFYASSSAIDCFLDPELYSSKKFSVQSDVYSFGVFLLELTSGREALCRDQSNSEPTLILQLTTMIITASFSCNNNEEAKDSNNLVNFVDKSLRDKSMNGTKQVVELALQCVEISHRRPSMKSIVEELERIQEKEIGRLHFESGEEIGVVKLGSELFK